MSDGTGQGTQAHPRDLIRAALAGMEEGGAQIGEGGSHSGPPLHDTAPQGWKLQVSCDFAERAGAAGGGDPLVYRFYVDHVGLGRRDAIPMYLEALRAAGLEASLAPAGGGSSRQVVWLAGTFDGKGRRIK